MTSRTDTIRDLNDRYRRGDNAIPGWLVMTNGVQELVGGGALRALLVDTVRRFDEFDTDNDPHGEHDFAAFDFGARRLFWKIDYYAPDMEHGSEDPADVTKTVRVLTIMLAEEY